MVYTVLIGIICLGVMMYMFDIQISEVKYSTNTKKYLLKDDNYQKSTEYLKTLFFTYINENKDGINKVGIDEFFNVDKASIVKYDKSKVSYSNKTNEFIFITPYKLLINRNDYFKLQASSDSFELIFIKTEYTNN